MASASLLLLDITARWDGIEITRTAFEQDNDKK